MKYLKLAILLIFIFGCSTKKLTYEDYAQVRNHYEQKITAGDLKSMLTVYASDEFEGRKTGEEGQKKAVEYIKSIYKKNGIKPPPGMKGNYFQEVPMEYINSKKQLVSGDSENVLAYIKGSEYPEEVVVVSAHLDHLGMEGEKIYNGADDDGSGTVAVMEIAKAMQDAVKGGFRPKRSILFLHVTGEEFGLWGSKYYSEHPVFPMNETIADLNIDMIGRVDDDHRDNPDYIYPIGSDMLSDDLHEILLDVNASTKNLTLDFKYNAEDDPNRFYYRSDHYNFAKNNVPVIFFFNGVHADYHKETDTADKINYEVLTERTQLIFNILWELVNRNDTIQLKEN